MTITVIKGNLLDLAEQNEYDYIMHGCNCFHAMGSGIAGQIAKRYPEALRVDKLTKYGDPSKLGSYSVSEIKGVRSSQLSLPLLEDEDKTDEPMEYDFGIINLYTQYKPGPDFISSVFPTAIERINKEFAGYYIGVPMIGCGIGGGKLEDVMESLVNNGTDVDWEMVLL